MNTAIHVNTSFFPLAWILYMCTPVIEIDGEKNSRKWGTHSFEVSPGEHTVKIYFPYMWRSECGANQTTVNVPEGGAVNISYNMPPWMFAKGKIRVS